MSFLFEVSFTLITIEARLFDMMYLAVDFKVWVRWKPFVTCVASEELVSCVNYLVLCKMDKLCEIHLTLVTPERFQIEVNSQVHLQVPLLVEYLATLFTLVLNFSIYFLKREGEGTFPSTLEPVIINFQFGGEKRKLVSWIKRIHFWSYYLFFRLVFNYFIGYYRLILLRLDDKKCFRVQHR